jgi:hypothetical protein
MHRRRQHPDTNTQHGRQASAQARTREAEARTAEARAAEAVERARAAKATAELAELEATTAEASYAQMMRDTEPEYLAWLKAHPAITPDMRHRVGGRIVYGTIHKMRDD